MTRNNTKRWNTAFTRTFECRLPILSAPMAGVAGGLLAAEVFRAGGLGMIAAGHLQDVDGLESQIKIFQDRIAKSSEMTTGSSQHRGHGADLAIGFIGFSTFATSVGWENYERILANHRPKAVQCFAPAIVSRTEGGVGASNVKLAHDHGVKFIAQVGSVEEAEEAIRHKVDAIICQGSEAGGHCRRRELGNSTAALASQVSKMAAGHDVPVLAAGGIVNGRHLASMLCVCDGVSMGTRYWASRESLGNEVLQRELVKDNSCDDVVQTSVFDRIGNEMTNLPWPHPYDSSGALRNQTTEKWDGKSPDELRRAIGTAQFLDDYKASKGISDANVVPVYAGQGVGEIQSIEGAYDITLKVEEEAINTIDRLGSI